MAWRLHRCVGLERFSLDGALELGTGQEIQGPSGSDGREGDLGVTGKIAERFENETSMKEEQDKYSLLTSK